MLDDKTKKFICEIMDVRMDVAVAQNWVYYVIRGNSFLFGISNNEFTIDSYTNTDGPLLSCSLSDPKLVWKVRNFMREAEYCGVE